MLKNFFLFLSTHRTLRKWMETSSSARRLSQRFIAGNELEDGLEVIRELQARGVFTALDPLGENVSTEAEAIAAAQNARGALEAAITQGAGATISVKLTQLGLDLSTELAFANVSPLVTLAKEKNSRVEIDMESTAYTQRTVEMLEALAPLGPVRAVLQAYLFRTADDVERMNRLRIPVRLCKGAYNEPPHLAMKSKADVDANYKKLATLLLKEGTYPAIATHDPEMIEHALAQHPRKSEFEFQMLYGIRRDLQDQLAADGWRLRLYVPYGEAWYPYFMRRLAERPANVWFVVKNLLR